MTKASKRRQAAALAFTFSLSIPSGCGYDADAIGRVPERVIITDLGAVGTPDDSKVFQAAADEAEKRGTSLVLPPRSTINLRGNVYLGDLTLAAAGATINCIYDGKFTYRGTASLRINGCILTKSAEKAGYGRRTVSIHFDSLTVNTIRLVGGTDAKIGLLLENTDHFDGQTLSGKAQGTGVGEVTPFDFRRGVQGVRIDHVVGHMQNGAGAGGFWIRNDSPMRATANIAIGAVEMDGATADELVSIFNTGNAKADLHDIHIGDAILHADGGCGQGLSIFRNAGAYNRQSMKRIGIDRIKVDVVQIGPKLSLAPGVFAVKVNSVDAQIGSIALRYSGSWASDLPRVYGLRYVAGRGQTTPLHVSTLTVSVNAQNHIPKGEAAMAWGPVVIDNFFVRGTGSGFRHIAVGAQDLRNVDAQTTALFADPFSNSFHVRGRWNGLSIDR